MGIEAKIKRLSWSLSWRGREGRPRTDGVLPWTLSRAHFLPALCSSAHTTITPATTHPQLFHSPHRTDHQPQTYSPIHRSETMLQFILLHYYLGRQYKYPPSHYRSRIKFVFSLGLGVKLSDFALRINSKLSVHVLYKHGAERVKDSFNISLIIYAILLGILLKATNYNLRHQPERYL